MASILVTLLTILSPVPPAFPQLSPPTLLSPENGWWTNDNTPFFDWTAVEGADSYQILVDNDPNFTSPEINDFPTADNYTPTVELPEGVYYWKVRARNTGTGESSDWSATWMFGVDLAPPPAPSLLSPENGENLCLDQPTFTWTPVSDPTGVQYHLLIDNDQDFSSPFYSLFLPVTSHQVENKLVENFSPYYWKVVAVDGAGNENSSAVFFFRLKVPPSSCVDTLSPYWQTAPFTVTVTASDNDGWVENVELWYCYSPDNSSWGDWQLYENDSAPPYSFLFVPPANGFYRFYSRAWDERGNCESVPLQPDTECGYDNTPPAKLENLLPENNSVFQVTTLLLGWAPLADLSGVSYELILDDESLPSEPYVLHLTGLVENEVQLTLEPSRTYYWEVRAIDGAGNTGAWSDVCCFTISIWYWLEGCSAGVKSVVDWCLLENWVGEVAAPHIWKLLEDWTCGALAAGGWRLLERVEGWAGSWVGWYRLEGLAAGCGTLAEWGFLEGGTGALAVLVEWRMIHSFSVSAVSPPPAWSVLESWSGGVPTFSNWETLEGCLCAVSLAACWTALEGWISNPVGSSAWRMVEGVNAGCSTPWGWRDLDSRGAQISIQVGWWSTVESIAGNGFAQVPAPVLLSPPDGTNINPNLNPLELEWENLLPADNFLLQVDNDQGFSSPEVEVWLSSTSYSPSGLADNLYWWRVMQFRSGENSAWSEVRRFRVDTVSPPACTLLFPAPGSNVNDNTPLFRWGLVQENSLPLSYWLEIDNEPAFNPPVMLSVGWLWDNSYQLENSLADGMYYWRVKVRDNAGNLGVWSSGDFRVDTISPVAPAPLSPVGYAWTTLTPTLEWGSVPENSLPVLYQAYICESSTFDAGLYRVYTSPWLAENWWTAPVLVEGEGLEGKVFYWRVRARDNAGNLSDNSPTQSFRTDNISPSTPVLLSPENSSFVSTFPTLSYSASDNGSGVSSYWVQVFDEGLNLFYENTEAGNQLSLQLPVGIYWWRVRARDAAGNLGAWSDNYTFQACQWEGLEDWEGTSATMAGWEGVESLQAGVGIPIGWQRMESWAGKVGATAGWIELEELSGTILALAGWLGVESCAGSVRVPASWLAAEGWIITAAGVAGWRELEGFAGTIRGVAGWTVTDSWAGSISFPTSWMTLEGWTGNTLGPASWCTIDTWTGTTVTTVSWTELEGQSGTILTPVGWLGVESCAGSVRVPASWLAAEGWIITADTLAGWRLLEAWMGTTSAPVGWIQLENRTGNLQAPIGWSALEGWETGTVSPAYWCLLESLSASVAVPIGWGSIEAWFGQVGTAATWMWTEALSGIVLAPVPVPILLSPLYGENTNDNTPTFTWENLAPADNFELQVDNDADFSPPLIIFESVSFTSYTPSSPLQDDLYHWRVRQWRTGENSPWSQVWTFRVDTLKPAPPVLVSPLPGENENDSTPLLVWQAPPENSLPLTYRVQISTTPTFLSGTILVDDNSVTENAWEPPALDDNLYYWRVAARDNAGNWGSFSSARSFRVDTLPPAAPTLLLPENGAPVEKVPTLSWESVAENSLPVLYFIQVAQTDDFTVGLMESGWITENSWICPPLTETVWYWRVRARDNAGNVGPWSGTRWFLVSPGWVVLDSWTGSALARAVWAQVESWAGTTGTAGVWCSVEVWAGAVGTQLQWQLVEGWSGTVMAPTGWRVVESCTGTVAAPAGWREVDKWTATARTLTGWLALESCTGILQAPALWFVLEGWEGGIRTPAGWLTTDSWAGVTRAPATWLTIEAWTGTFRFPAGWLVLEAVSSSTPAPSVWKWLEARAGTVAAPIYPPVLLAPENALNTSDNTPTFSWENLQPVDYFELQVDSEEGFSPPLVVQVNTGITSYTSSELLDGPYWWRVRCWRTETAGPWSVVRFLRVDTLPPAPPQLLSPLCGQDVSDSTPVLRWTVPPENSSPLTYNLRISTSPYFEPDNLVLNLWVDENSYEVLGLQENVVYYWKVLAKDNAGNVGFFPENAWWFKIDTSPPSSPTLLLPENQGWASSSAVLGWAPVPENSPPVLYRVEISDFPEFFNLVRVAEIYENGWTVSPPLPVSTYYWRVKARDNALNWGPWSPVRWFRIDVDAPSKPTLLFPENESHVQADAGFQAGYTASDGAGSGVGSYTIQVASNPVFSPVLFENTVQENVCNVSPLAPGKYYWRVRAIDRVGNVGPWSDSFIVYSSDWTFLEQFSGTVRGAVSWAEVERWSLEVVSPSSWRFCEDWVYTMENVALGWFWLDELSAEAVGVHYWASLETWSSAAVGGVSWSTLDLRQVSLGVPPSYWLLQEDWLSGCSAVAGFAELEEMTFEVSAPSGWVEVENLEGTCVGVHYWVMLESFEVEAANRQWRWVEGWSSKLRAPASFRGLEGFSGGVGVPPSEWQACESLQSTGKGILGSWRQVETFWERSRPIPWSALEARGGTVSTPGSWWRLEGRGAGLGTPAVGYQFLDQRSDGVLAPHIWVYLTGMEGSLSSPISWKTAVESSYLPRFEWCKLEGLGGSAWAPRWVEERREESAAVPSPQEIELPNLSPSLESVLARATPPGFRVSVGETRYLPLWLPRPEGEIYTYLDLIAENAQLLRLRVRVEKGWLQRVDRNTLRVLGYRGGWREVPFEAVREDAGFLYLEFRPGDLSCFAVMAKRPPHFPVWAIFWAWLGIVGTFSCLILYPHLSELRLRRIQKKYERVLRGPVYKRMVGRLRSLGRRLGAEDRGSLKELIRELEAAPPPRIIPIEEKLTRPELVAVETLERFIRERRKKIPLKKERVRELKKLQEEMLKRKGRG